MTDFSNKLSLKTSDTGPSYFDFVSQIKRKEESSGVWLGCSLFFSSFVPFFLHCEMPQDIPAMLLDYLLSLLSVASS